jgi:spore maturation protein CgeB
MKIVYFTHSIVSDWNHGNAHFLRGVVSELQERGHDVAVYEPRASWSREHLVREHGRRALDDFHAAFPALRPRLYDDNVEELVDGADVVIVHEWNEPSLVAAVGREHGGGHFRLLFHDTHHRMATAPEEMKRYDLSDYDGVLAYGEAIADLWGDHASVWHEAADTRVFRPQQVEQPDGDLVWVGNWGDGERTEELQEFLLDPAEGLSGSVYGVRYPEDGRRAVSASGLEYRGWVANHRVPEVFGRHRVTVHVPRRPYRESLPGIPTIRPFEALACGIPLITAPWDDDEHLFTPGRDYLVANTGREMRDDLREVLNDASLAESLAEHGRRTILERHTCAHRVDELLALVAR